MARPQLRCLSASAARPAMAGVAFGEAPVGPALEATGQKQPSVA
jgi:hypothetical protein